VVTLVLARLDYCNGVLVGLPTCQSNAPPPFDAACSATRLIFNQKRSDPITVALISLHSLRIPERIR
jgi:hypothetical protein